MVKKICSAKMKRTRISKDTEMPLLLFIEHINAKTKQYAEVEGSTPQVDKMERVFVHDGKIRDTEAGKTLSCVACERGVEIEAGHRLRLEDRRKTKFTGNSGPRNPTPDFWRGGRTK
jgi:hypothetical protein